DLVKAIAALNQFKATTSRDPKRATSYANIRMVQVRLRAPGSSGAFVDIPHVAPAEAAGAAPPPARRPGGGAKETFDLSTFYGNEGALGESHNNLIPDRVDVLLSAEGNGTSGVADLAARLGLESPGVPLPIVKPAKAITAPDGEPILVLVGTSHPIVEQLIKDKKWERPALKSGEGLIQLVRKAFGEKSALIVTGGDAAGVDRAVQQLAQRFPHIWARGKDRTTLDDVEEDVRKFVAGRSPAGQAAMSFYKLDKISEQLGSKDLQSVDVKVFLEKADAGFLEFLRRETPARFKTSS